MAEWRDDSSNCSNRHYASLRGGLLVEAMSELAGRCGGVGGLIGALPAGKPERRVKEYEDASSGRLMMGVTPRHPEACFLRGDWKNIRRASRS